MNGNIFWLLELAVKEGQLDNLKTLMHEMVESTNDNEPGTMNYEWFLSGDEKSCHIYERYKDSDAVMKHLVAFGEKFAERFMSCLEPKGFTVYGTPDAGVKEALAAFAPVYMLSSAGFAR